MITENNVVPLFGIPLCQTQLQPYDESADFIMNKVNYVERSHKVCYISEDDYLLDKENLLPLKTEIMQKVSEFLHGYLDIEPKHNFVMTTSWSNRYEQNHFIDQHYHSNSLFSGVLFLTDCKDTANIVFHKDKNHNNIFTDTTSGIVEVPDNIIPIIYDNSESYRNQFLSCIKQIEEEYIWAMALLILGHKK